MVVRISDTVDNAIDVSVLRKSDCDNSRILPNIFANTFLKLRYTKQRREAIFKHYSGIKNIITRWLILFGAIIIFAAMNFMLRYHFGVIAKKL